MSENVKRQFIGEAKFIRAFCYFYLFNLFGDVPYVSSATNWATNTLAKRVSKDQIYGQILADLKESESNLRQDYSISGGERTRANSYSASAMLARVYLYQGKWDSASIEASRVINNTNQFGLETDLSRVFLANNNEAILQWQLNSGLSSTFNATPEAYNNLPSDQSTPPLYYLSPDLLKSFENGDLRHSLWVDSSVNSGVTYYYSYKYKVGPGQISPSSPATEYYMVLRLAEQYLIRAEGEAQQNKLDLAIADINMIRGRAHLLPLPSSLNQNQVLSAILQERRVELFSEWGHRWFDLKRWEIASQVLTANKGFTVDNHSLLYPIPQSELQTDPNLTQNPGY